MDIKARLMRILTVNKGSYVLFVNYLKITTYKWINYEHV